VCGREFTGSVLGAAGVLFAVTYVLLVEATGASLVTIV
jgi:hypothetical protein